MHKTTSLLAGFFGVSLLSASGYDEAERIMREYRAIRKVSIQNAKTYQRIHKEFVRIGNPAIGALVEAIYDETLDISLRAGPITFLTFMGTPEAKETLKSVWLGVNLDLRLRYLSGKSWSVLASGVEDVKWVLEKALLMKEGGVVLNPCIRALGRLRDKAGLPLLFLVFEDDKRLLEKAPEGERVVDAWLSAAEELLDSTGTIRGDMISDKSWKNLEALCRGFIPLPSGKEPVTPIEVTKDKIIFRHENTFTRHVSNREDLARLLASIQDKRSLMLLGYLTKDTDPEVRLTAVRSMKRHSGEDALRILRQVAAHDPDKAVRAFAENQMDVREGRPPRREVVLKSDEWKKLYEDWPK